MSVFPAPVDAKSCARVSEPFGPLLAAVIRVQGLDEVASSYPRIEEYAMAVVDAAAPLGNPVLWPVGMIGERITGAAILLGRGRVRARAWNDSAVEAPVLLLAGALVTPLPLFNAAEHARRLGALKVFACALEIGGQHDLSYEGIDRLILLGAPESALAAA